LFNCALLFVICGVKSITVTKLFISIVKQMLNEKSFSNHPRNDQSALSNLRTKVRRNVCERSFEYMLKNDSKGVCVRTVKYTC